MVRRLIPLLLLFPCLAVAAATEVSVQLVATQIEQGEALRGALIVRGIATPPTFEMLRPLATDFAVVPQGVSAAQGNRSYRLMFNLYARHTGHIVLPRLRVAGNLTQPLVVTVTPATAQPAMAVSKATMRAARAWSRGRSISTSTPINEM